MDGQPPPDDHSIGHLVSRLVEDAERFAGAQIGLYRAQIATRVADAKIALLLGAGAFVIAQSALVALLVGLVLAIAQALHSAAWATVIVVGAALAIAAVMIAVAVARIKRLTGSEDTPE